MSALLVVDGVRASTCTGSPTHRPRPTRFVWHHVLPQVCGGLTVPANLAQLCDNCHYTVHALLFELKIHAGNSGSWGRLGTVGQRGLAWQGYADALAAGTVDKIPNEGSANYGGHE